MKLRKRPNTDSEEIDITSLLDILVILLIFLLKSYNSSDLSVDLVSELSLPYSTSLGITNLGVVLQVNENRKVFINNELVGDLTDKKSSNEAIRAKLKSEFAKVQAGKAEKTVHLINLVLDKTLKYKYIDELLQISNESGFSSYKLIVQGRDG